MNKKNAIPTTNEPSDAPPTQVVDEGDNLRRVGAPPPQAQALVAVLDQSVVKIKSFLTGQGTLDDLIDGTEGVVKVAKAGFDTDPLMPKMEVGANAKHTLPAFQEIQQHQATLNAANPLVMARIDMVQTAKDATRLAQSDRMGAVFTTAADEMDTQSRHYTNRVAPTAVTVFFKCRETIENHAGLQNKMPNLTTLAIGTGVNAAEAGRNNDRVRAQTLAHHGAPAAAAPPPATPTTVTVSPGTVPAPVTAPAPAAAPGKTRSRKKIMKPTH